MTNKGGNSFTWSGDLIDSNFSAQYVSSISGDAGDGGTVPLHANNLQFDGYQQNPSINQITLLTISNADGYNGQDLNVAAQSGQSTADGYNGGNGGKLILSSGAGGSSDTGNSGTAGVVSIQNGGVEFCTFDGTSGNIFFNAQTAANNGGVDLYVNTLLPTGISNGLSGGVSLIQVQSGQSVTAEGFIPGDGSALEIGAGGGGFAEAPGETNGGKGGYVLIGAGGGGGSQDGYGSNGADVIIRSGGGGSSNNSNGGNSGNVIITTTSPGTGVQNGINGQIHLQ